MGVVMGVTAVILGIAAGLVGLMLWTALVFPRPTEQARRSLEARPGRCFLAGATLALLLGVPAFGMIHAPHGLVKLAGWALALPLLAGLTTGLTGMAQLLGERLRELSPGMTPLAALVRGAVTIELAMIIPFVGWLLFTPIVGLTVTGAGAIGCLRRRRDYDKPPRHNGHEEVNGFGEGADMEGLDPEDRAVTPAVHSLCALCAFLVPFLR
jgi:hypothetical protein